MHIARGGNLFLNAMNVTFKRNKGPLGNWPTLVPTLSQLLLYLACSFVVMPNYTKHRISQAIFISMITTVQQTVLI